MVQQEKQSPRTEAAKWGGPDQEQANRKACKRIQKQVFRGHSDTFYDQEHHH
jgi:hypothetical protein